jgi:curved DNA-binding protein CbpA
MSDKPGKKERIEMSAERAELITSMHDRIDKMDLFTLLDADLNANPAVLRRAYFKQSLLFHPDRYFSKDIGSYKKMLERIFGLISAAYDFLKDDRQRAAYRKKLLNSRDAAVGTGGVVAVQTASGLVFKIVDETSFFAADEAAVAAGGDKVMLPQKRYAMPRVRAGRAAPARAAQPPAEPEQPESPSASDEDEGLDFDIDVSFDD